MGSFSLHSCSFALFTSIRSRSAFTMSRYTKLEETTCAVLFSLGCGCVFLVYLMCMHSCCCACTGTCCFGNDCCLVVLAAALQAPAYVRAAGSAGTYLVYAQERCVFGMCLRCQIESPGWPSAASPWPGTAGQGCTRGHSSRHGWPGEGGWLGLGPRGIFVDSL